MKLAIVSPDKTVFKGENVTSISIPTTTGIITILEDHMPLVSQVSEGVLTVSVNKTELFFAISGGVVEVNGNNSILILAQTAEGAADVDMQRAMEAKRKAEELMKNKEAEIDVDYAAIQAKINKEMARIAAALKFKPKEYQK